MTFVDALELAAVEQQLPHTVRKQEGQLKSHALTFSLRQTAHLAPLCSTSKLLNRFTGGAREFIPLSTAGFETNCFFE